MQFCESVGNFVSLGCDIRLNTIGIVQIEKFNFLALSLHLVWNVKSIIFTSIEILIYLLY